MAKWLSEWLTKSFICIVIVALIAFYAVTYTASVIAYNNAFSPAGMTAANDTYQFVQGVRHTNTALDVFKNNFFVSAMLILPLVGFAYFMTVMFNTGQSIGNLAAVTGYTPLAYLWGISIPVGGMEILAYAILGGEACYITYLMAKRESVTRRLLHGTWLSFILYVALLAVAALLEASTFA